MTQIGEGIAVTTITDPDRPHWVQVEYKYSNGKPVKGELLATDSEGMTWRGKLNDEGQANLSNLPAGSVEFELISEDIEDELKQTRANIIAGGKDIITDFGDAGVNKSIGSQWNNGIVEDDKTRVGIMDDIADKAIKNGQGDQKMNVRMHRCP